MINKILHGDALEVLKTLESETVNMCITSPPYYRQRNYGVDGQLGLESTPEEYITKLCDIFDEVKRVLRMDGTCFVNIGDGYSNCAGMVSMGRRVSGERGKNSSGNYRKPANKVSLPDKCLIQIPARFAIEMVNRGWILRNEIIWRKPNAAPCSVRDRFTIDFEKIYFFVKNRRYYFEPQYEPCKESAITQPDDKPGETKRVRRKRCVWEVPTTILRKAQHCAVYPEALLETPIKAGCPEGGVILDVFLGSGTTAVVARKLNRNYLGIELNKEYIEMANRRIHKEVKMSGMTNLK